MRFLLSIAVLFMLSGCGFEPVYGVNKNTYIGAEEKLSNVAISNIPDREGQYLRNALIDRFYRDGRPTDPIYNLNVGQVNESLINLDITKSADATRGQLRLNTSITLKDNRTNEIVLERSLLSVTSYNILGSEFATRISEDNTRLNALDDLARQIEEQLSLYFKRTD